jgi:hypothetical protein
MTKSSVIVTLPDGDRPAMFCAVGVFIIPEQPAVARTAVTTVALSDGAFRRNVASAKSADRLH